MPRDGIALGARPVGETEPKLQPVRVIDCDVHVVPRKPDEIWARLPEPHRATTQRAGLLGSGAAYYPPGGGYNRLDGVSPQGLRPGSDPEFLWTQLFDESGVDYAILVPNVAGFRAAEHEETMLATAQNEWLADTWLTSYNRAGRFFGSILVSPRDPRAAVREIDRWAGYAHFVQVLIYPTASPAFGHESYWPIYEAAAHHGLPIATHVKERTSIQRLTPVGFPSHYVDQRVTQWVTGATHLASLVFGGALARFPQLRFVMVELGYLWAASLMWRMDKMWQEFRDTMPQLTRPPSEYVKNQVRFTTQPFEAGPGHGSSQRDFHAMLSAIGAERTLMFSTDYPHWDGDYLPDVVLQRLPIEMRQQVACGNALELYRLPVTRSVD